MKKTCPVFLTVLLAIAGCTDPAQPGAAPQGFLLATNAGGVATSYAGDGWFYTGRFEDSSPQLAIRSTGLGGSDGSSYGLWGVFDGVPTPGRYPLVPQSRGGYPSAAFTGGYSWLLPLHERQAASQGDLVGEYFTIDSGWVEITAANQDRIDGRFELVVRRYCRIFAYEANPAPCDPFEAGDDDTTIQSVGEFSLVPFAEEDHEMPG